MLRHSALLICRFATDRQPKPQIWSSDPIKRATALGGELPLLDYLREHLNQAHSVDTLAQRAAMSRRTFTRHFSKATGTSFKDWLINERLQRTRELLESTSLPVETISDLVGFQTSTSLRQHFKRRNQVSPSEWRRTFGCG